MSDSNYIPPQVWQWTGEKTDLNQPTSGARYEHTLPVGKHPLQLYSLATPNGQKVTILLEELLALGHKDAEYDAWLIKIGEGQQFGSGFVEINPNSKIPALVDHSQNPPLRVFESGSILLYLAEKFKAFIPNDIADIAAFPWYGGLVKNWVYNGAEFLGVDQYKNVQRWADAILARPAVQRGRMVNRTFGDLATQLHERHDASDFETKTQDKLQNQS
ncbi:glutathione-dependent disulfide-bond oxidoreductase [Acinetobacter baumannii]|nr:glutathione-dependent disulfide-bond oxidoreductase [Acinetobacter baumannii]